MTDNFANLSSPMIESLHKLTNYIVSVTLLCYLAGFAISNMYLGSLGLVNLDILRTRYILVGLLFFLFLGAIAYLLYGLFLVIHENLQKDSLELVKDVFWYSIQNLSVLVAVVWAIAILTGSINTLPVGLPRVSQPIPWSEWLEVVPKRTLIASVFILGIILLAIILTIFIMILVNSKNKEGIRKSCKQQIIGILHWNKRGVILKALKGIVVLFAFIYLLMLLSSLFNFVSTNNLNGCLEVANVFSGGWERYLGGIALIYVFTTIIWVAIVLLRKLNSNNNEKNVNNFSTNPLAPISSNIYWIAMAISLIMPLYAYGIYPTIPQQVGGGKVISVELKVSGDEVKSVVLDSDIEIYLIDRTHDTTLFLLVNKNTLQYNAIEIANDSIKGIIYIAEHQNNKCGLTPRAADTASP